MTASEQTAFQTLTHLIKLSGREFNSGDSSKCCFVDIIKEQCTHQSIYQDLGALLALVERVDISQLLQQVHHRYGNMWPWLRTDQLIELSWRSTSHLSADG